MFMKNRRYMIMALVAAVLSFPVFSPRVEAMDPVTISLLAPVAVKAAQIAAPYVMRGLQCGAIQMVKIGRDVVDIFRLPLGALQAGVGWPLGMFQTGCSNLVQGFIAPFKMTFDVLLLPVALVGVNPGG